MSFLCHTDTERNEMLQAIGAGSMDDLFADIPESIRLGTLLDLPPAQTEPEISRTMRELSDKNSALTPFAGGGAYAHYIPAAVDHLAQRSEFYTAYTPYQPEVSQGTLAAIFEFQTMIRRLTGMDVANASMYDGATALAEAVLMCTRTAGRSSVLVCDSVHPHYREVLATYAWANGLGLHTCPATGGTADADTAAALVGTDVAAVVIQSPNFFGCIEDVAAVASAAHTAGAFCICVVTEPLSLGLLQAPGSIGADIVCGEGQPFGNPVGFGGPLLGLLAAKKKFLRKMPGRLVGKTVDADGGEAYVLTLQTREQHIRRDKATSNICTNQGLCALRAAVYLSLAGGKLQELARLNHLLAGRLRSGLSQAGCELLFERPYFNEFAVRVPDARALQKKMREQGFLFGVCLGDYYKDRDDALLLCCTELLAPADIDRALACLKAAL